MRRYRVFEPTGAEGQTERALFLRDGFRPWALVLPGLWLLRHRLWLWAGLAFAADILLKAVVSPSGVPLGAVLSLLGGLLVALEGPSLRARRLQRRGWRDAGAVWARDLRDAELLYFAGETTEPPVSALSPAPLAAVRSPLRPGLSLFDLRRAS